MKKANKNVLVALLNGDPSVTSRQSEIIQAILNGEPPPIIPMLVKQKELAIILDTTRQTIRRMTASGDLKTVQIGTLVRYPLADILAIAK